MKVLKFFSLNLIVSLAFLLLSASNINTQAALKGDQLLAYIPFDNIPEEVTNIDPAGFVVVNGALNIYGTVTVLVDEVSVVVPFQSPVTSAVGGCEALSLGFAIDVEANGVQITVAEVTFSLFSLPETSPAAYRLLCAAAQLTTQGKSPNGSATILNLIFATIRS